MKYLVCISFCVAFFFKINGQNAHKDTPGFIVLSDFKTPYQVRIDPVQKIIQVGSYSEVAEYQIFEDTIIAESYREKELFPKKVPKIYSLLSPQKKIPKKYEELQKELSVFFKNKVFLIKELEEGILFICTRYPQKQSPFKRISFCHIINVSTYENNDTIYTNNFTAKTDLEFFFDKINKKYVLVSKERGKKKDIISSSLITIPSL